MFFVNQTSLWKQRVLKNIIHNNKIESIFMIAAYTMVNRRAKVSGSHLSLTRSIFKL
jgi:hypothetical protein